LIKVYAIALIYCREYENLRFYYIIIITTTTTFVKWLYHRRALSFGWKTGLGLNTRGAASSFHSLSPDLFRLSLPCLSFFFGPFFLRSPAISNWATQFPSFASREKFLDCANVAAARLLNRWQWRSMLRRSQQQTRAMPHNDRVSLLRETAIF